MFTRTRASSRLRLTAVMTCLIIAVCTAYVGAQEPIVRPQQVTKWDKTTDSASLGSDSLGQAPRLRRRELIPARRSLFSRRWIRSFRVETQEHLARPS